MGTRGVFGFRKNGHTIATYRHWDSYPEGLGRDFVDFLKSNNLKRIDKFFSNIIEVESDKPTEEQKKYCIDMGWYEESVSSRSTDDWYCLLYGLQDPEKWEKAIYDNKPVYVDNSINFLVRDSLFCEYGYIYNITDMVLEFYVGFQRHPQENNPYGQYKNNDGYYPCRLIGKLYMDNEMTLKYIDVSDVVGWMKILDAQYEREM